MSYGILFIPSGEYLQKCMTKGIWSPEDYRRLLFADEERVEILKDYKLAKFQTKRFKTKKEADFVFTEQYWKGYGGSFIEHNQTNYSFLEDKIYFEVVKLPVKPRRSKQ